MPCFTFRRAVRRHRFAHLFVLLAVAVFCVAAAAQPRAAHAANAIDSSIVALDSGNEHTLALTKGGRVLAWGRNHKGQLGDGTTFDRSAPQFVQGLPTNSAIVQVAAGASFSLALTADGRVFAWGENNGGQLGDGTYMHRSLPRQVTIPGGTLIASIAADGSSYAVTQAGEAWAWGPSADGQLGNNKSVWKGGIQKFNTPQSVLKLDGANTPPKLTGIAQIAAGSNHAIARLANGELWSFGSITHGQLGLNAGTITSSGRPVAEKITLTASCVPTDIAAAAASSYVVCANGKAYSFGSGNYGQLGISQGYKGDATYPQVMATTGTVVRIIPNGTSALILRADESVQGIGYNSLYDLGTTPTSDQPVPLTLPHLAGSKLLAFGARMGVSLGANGDLKGWGITDRGELGDGQARYRDTALAIPGVSGVTAIAAGKDYSVAVGVGGSVWTWGNNTSGTLGDGTTTPRVAPAQIAGLTGVTAVSASPTASSSNPSHVLARTASGAVYAWGDNASGQLGDGSTTRRTAPVLINVPGTVVGIAAGTTHSLAVTSTGAVYAWGSSAKGQVGDGALGGTFTAPRLVTTLPPGAVEVGAGETVSVARLASGAIYAWGGNASTEVGGGVAATTPALTPVHSNAGETWTAAALAVGANHVLVRTTTGEVWGWGANIDDQLHVINRTRIETPTRVFPTLGLTGVTMLASGSKHLFAQTSSGELYGWGESSEYQIGHGAYGDYGSVRPWRVTLAAGDPVSAIAGGYQHTLVVRGGKVYGWGFTGEGALAIAQTRFTTSPTAAVVAPTVAEDATSTPAANSNRPSGGDLGANPAPAAAANVAVTIYGAGTVRIERASGRLEQVCQSDSNTRNGFVGDMCTVSGIATGTQLTATVAAAPGYQFIGFEAPGTVCVGASTCTFTLTSDVLVRARFADSTPPETEIFSKPPLVSSSASGTHVLWSSEPGATFKCKIDDGPVTNCTSQASFSNLANGTHTFEAYSIDVSGNIDPTPARNEWTINTGNTPVPPTAGILSGPADGSTTTERTATFAFAPIVAQAGVYFRCAVGQTAYTACVSPLILTNLPLGTHTFAVKAYDANNVEQTAAVEMRTWTIVAPTPVIPDPTPGGAGNQPVGPPTLGGGTPAPPAPVPSAPAPIDTTAPMLTITPQACPPKLKGAKCTAFRTTAAAWRKLVGTVTDTGTAATGAGAVHITVYRKVGRTFQVVSGTRVVTKPKLTAAQAVVNAASVSGSGWTRALPKLAKGSWTLRLRALDKAGNASGWTTRTIAIK